MQTTRPYPLTLGVLLFLSVAPAGSQQMPEAHSKFPARVSTSLVPVQALEKGVVPFKIPGKKASQYTSEDWENLIDSTWGPGQTATEQLNIFDTFWGTVDQQWAGFPNLSLNWDSMKTLYRPQIGSGLSRGRFYALMSQMGLALTEYHSLIIDYNVDSVFGSGLPPPRYRRGVPLFIVGPIPSLLGVAVSPMADSSNLVYRVAPDNPLGLEPGDLVLGYEGVPWKQLYMELLNAGLPISTLYSVPGSTPEAKSYCMLSGVGNNWGMFDTIDVVKYSSGDTLHLPTAPLATLSQTVYSSDQLPIAGVPMPEGVYGSSAVSWGVVAGTNIGYIYAWDWASDVTRNLFRRAVYELCNTKKVEGLVLDFRMNWGGNPAYADPGLSLLFSADPSHMLMRAQRNNPLEHLGFSVQELPADLWGVAWGLTPVARPFDRPIAVLTGPGCLSAGDWNVLRMRFHPMGRLFGKPTNGAFVGGDYAFAELSDAWLYQLPTSILYSNVQGEGYLIHQGVRPDEEVWLTRDGVAKGEDDVVKRAIEWITTLSYTRDVAIDRSFTPPGSDSVCVTATLVNPLHHTVALSAIVTDTGGVLRDSVVLHNDGLHGDGSAGDSVWGGGIRVPSDENLFSVGVRADDITQGTWTLANPVGFATAGPLTLDTVGVWASEDSYSLKPFIRNDGASLAIPDVSVILSCADAFVTYMAPTTFDLPSTIPPGGVLSPNGVCYIYPTTPFPGYFNVTVQIFTNGLLCWTDSMRLIVTGLTEEKGLPVAYELSQNYPNPFNPSTTIRYGLPSRSHVTLTVFNTLGQQVATLVQGEQEAGYHETVFDASGLASGVYLYRLQAGEFVQTRKLVLVR